MSIKSKVLSMLLVILAVVALGATGIFAQDSADPAAPPCPMFGGGGYGMMRGNGLHLMWEGDTPPMWSALANALGIDVETLSGELQSGKTLAELAAEYDIDLDTLTAEMQAAMEAHLSDLVAAGVLTQEQADLHLSQMEERWEQMPMFNGAGFSMMHAGRHHGMWGNDVGRGMGRRGG